MKEKSLNNKILDYAKTLSFIAELGGKCQICGINKFECLTFHHKNNKIENVSSLKRGNWRVAREEIKKCDLLCDNCHRELHYETDNKDERRLSKDVYVQYKNNKCEICSYNKCLAALVFHHKDPNEKEFDIGSLNLRIESLEDLNEIIKVELDKCMLLCANCHDTVHFDAVFYKNNILKIKNKIESHREIQSKIDRNIIIDMYVNKKMKIIQISKELNASRGTISDIIKQLKFDGYIEFEAKDNYKKQPKKCVKCGMVINKNTIGKYCKKCKNTSVV